MRVLSRRAVLCSLGAGGLGLVALRCSLPRIWRARGIRPVEELSSEARELVARAFDGLRRERIVDLHVHALGLGRNGSGCWVNPRFSSHFHPLERLRFELYLAAGGVEDDDRADELYVERLLALQRAANPQGKLLLLAFDGCVREDGELDRDMTPFLVPDDYVLGLARAHPELLPCASVHPYRADALERLQRARAQGAVAVKWLPNSMGIDPSAPRCRPFYRELAQLGLSLLVHAGEEQAVWVEDGQELGNPLRLRAALDEGVTVVALHCASLGEARDLDREGAPATPGFELFLRLMDEPRAAGRLFGELSALTQINRGAAPLRELLARPDLHRRLLNGSDYPLVALDPLISLGLLVRRGFLEGSERAPLREVFEANPLLFDLVLKRRLRLRTAEGEHGFEPQVFESARLFDKLS
jgi:uncharacterized protein